MRVLGAVLMVVLVWPWGCSFKSDPRHENDPVPTAGRGANLGSSGSTPGTAGSAGSSNPEPGMDAAVVDATVPNVDGGTGDGGEKPPEEHMPPEQNGGLK